MRRGRRRKCKLGKEGGRERERGRVFKSFLNVERDTPALVVLVSSFHQRGTTNENRLDCRACTDGSAKRRSLDERSVLGVTFALTRAFRCSTLPVHSSSTLQTFYNEECPCCSQKRGLNIYGHSQQINSCPWNNTGRV